MISKIVSRRLFRNLPLIAKTKYSVSNIPPSQIDPSNVLGLIQASSQPILSFGQKISYFSLSSLYHSADTFARQLLFTLANDYALGAGLTVFIISVSIKTLFLYPTLIAQINGMKMKSISKDLQIYKQKIKIARMTNNIALQKQAGINFRNARSSKGIDNFYTLINILQIPILITWFIALRQIFSLPELYPQLQSQGYLWFQDLTNYDPYFILPLIAATSMSYSIANSPSITQTFSTNPMLAPVIKYLKWMPFLSLPFTCMFPAGINFYWLTLSLCQSVITFLMNSQFVQQKFGLKKFSVVQPKIVKAVIMENKSNLTLKQQKQQQNRNNSESSVNKSESSVNKSDISVNKFESLVNKSESSANKSESSVNKSESSVNKSESSVNKSESSDNKSESSVNKSESSVNKFQSQANNLKNSVDKSIKSVPGSNSQGLKLLKNKPPKPGKKKAPEK